MYQFRTVSYYITSNCIRIDRQYSPCPVPMSSWLLQAPTINQAHLTHFAPCWLATLLFQVFCIPISSNDIGLHTMWILITPQFMVLNSEKKVISHRLIMSKITCIYAWFHYILVPMHPVLLYLIDYSTIFNSCKVSISLQSCFVKLSSHLRDCNRHDDWHSCQNMDYNICKPIQSCPTWIRYFHFV